MEKITAKNVCIKLSEFQITKKPAALPALEPNADELDEYDFASDCDEQLREQPWPKTHTLPVVLSDPVSSLTLTLF